MLFPIFGSALSWAIALLEAPALPAAPIHARQPGALLAQALRHVGRLARPRDLVRLVTTRVSACLRGCLLVCVTYLGGRRPNSGIVAGLFKGAVVARAVTGARHGCCV